jgi:serine/threonine protein kinase
MAKPSKLFTKILKLHRSFCGTPDYIAWEIVNNKEYNESVDWWSLGVLIFELCSGKTPFRARTSDQIYRNIIEMNIQWLPPIRGACMDIIQRLLVNNPQFRLGHRLGAPEIKMHAWFNTVNWKKLALRQIEPPMLPSIPVSADQIEKTLGTKESDIAEFCEYFGDIDQLDDASIDPKDPFIDF